MEEQTDRLVQKVYEKYKTLAPEKRYLVGISGIPGSGKTSLALNTVSHLNILSRKAHAEKISKSDFASGVLAVPPLPIAAYLPMDGYHYTRAQLDSMPDPENAHARRGAAFTFDSESLLTTVKALRKPLEVSSPNAIDRPGEKYSGDVILAPSFDHKLKDPVEEDIKILPSSKIIILEGNYLSLNKEIWKEIAREMDELWFVEVDFGVAKKRLIKRHVEAGIASSPEEAAKRADENDLVNGKEIVDDRWEEGITEYIQSIEDKEWSL